MKALTISQPFASLIASGEKWIENRIWYTSYRGPLAIHAGKGLQYLSRQELADFPSGCVIAIANLVACQQIKTIRCCEKSEPEKLVPFTKKTWREVFQHEHTEGPFCWFLEDVKPIDPFYCRGGQRIWNVNLSPKGVAND
jgi:hypothetical protein